MLRSSKPDVLVNPAYTLVFSQSVCAARFNGSAGAAPAGNLLVVLYLQIIHVVLPVMARNPHPAAPREAQGGWGLRLVPQI